MSSTRAQLVNRLWLAYAALAILAVYWSGTSSPPSHHQLELLGLRVFAVGATLAHLHYGVCVVRARQRF
jgi:hypothetical protein